MEWDLLKVATFNINNINKRLDNLLAWLAKAEPDVVSLQELKAEQEAYPVNALRTLGYEAIEKDSSAIGENGPLKQSWWAFGIQPRLPCPSSRGHGEKKN
jgi:hypothetical protein